MKRLFAILLVILFACGLIFADAGLEGSDNKTSNLTLTLDGDAYSVGFSRSKTNYTHLPSIELSENISTGDMTVCLANDTFYFFYKAITEASNVAFKISVSPLYWNNTQTSDTSKTINYQATIVSTSEWDGNACSINLRTSDVVESGPIMLKNNSVGSEFVQYFAKGVAEVSITSSENLGTKVPGSYTGSITVTLVTT